MIQGKNDIFQITCSFLEAFKRHVIDERQRYEKRKSESRRRRQRRNGAKERLGEFRQQYQERARSGRAYNESLKGDESSRYRDEIHWRKFETHRSRYGSEERMGFALPDGSFTLLVIVADSRQRQWKELLVV